MLSREGLSGSAMHGGITWDVLKLVSIPMRTINSHGEVTHGHAGEQHKGKPASMYANMYVVRWVGPAPVGKASQKYCKLRSRSSGLPEMSV